MIKPSTISLLKSLSENNNREWFGAHKSEYEIARDNILEFTSQLMGGIAKFDKTVPTDLNPKDCLMRVYRDIRFSKDKTPYKTNFGIAISAQGKNFKGPGYYINIKPGDSFIAGGCWFPEKDELKAIRQEIDYNGSALREVISDSGFKKYFNDLDREGSLKTTPKGYEANHEDIEYLKLKSFTATHNLPDNLLTSTDLVSKIMVAFENLYPLMVFLRNAIA